MLTAAELKKQTDAVIAKRKEASAEFERRLFVQAQEQAETQANFARDAGEYGTSVVLEFADERTGARPPLDGSQLLRSGRGPPCVRLHQGARLAETEKDTRR